MKFSRILQGHVYLLQEREYIEHGVSTVSSPSSSTTTTTTSSSSNQNQNPKPKNRMLKPRIKKIKLTHATNAPKKTQVKSTRPNQRLPPSCSNRISTARVLVTLPILLKKETEKEGSFWRNNSLFYYFRYFCFKVDVFFVGFLVVVTIILVKYIVGFLHCGQDQIHVILL